MKTTFVMAKAGGKVTVATCSMDVVPPLGSKILIDGKGTWTVTGIPAFVVFEKAGAAALNIAVEADDDTARKVVEFGIKALTLTAEQPETDPPAEKDKV